MQLVKGSPAIGEEEEDHDLMLSAWFRESRHVETIVGEVLSNEERDNWRKFVRERMKTVSVALVLCLNIGVDPPDVAKPNPCAKLECWIDPLSTQSQKAMDKIGAALQKQYERWQPRARYKVANDPTVEEVKKLCSSMRRNAKEERVLFHYNGHGVPRPTENGEIWVFNKNFTQYIPLSIYDLQAWMGHPSVYVWDCNSAGTVVKSFNRFAIDHEREWNNQFDAHRGTLRPPLPVGEMTLDQQADATGFRRPPNYRECIQLAACQEGELLPTNPDMPADLFTSTLTTPIKTSVLWYIAKNGVKDRFPANIVDQIPGQLNDRRTLLGELNWIFTAITDTIAWNTLPRELFQKLFRQDLLVASLFRNFLLADRLMRAHNCRPLSSPSLPATADHPLWESWDYTLDLCLSHLQRPSSPALELAPSPNSR
uniref:Raptor N-terminal CASPase-like domain-containing protein n=1 Tax=Plectus sambesii TaxID=2011161 RepID=A0A914X4V9_9BILA